MVVLSQTKFMADCFVCYIWSIGVRIRAIQKPFQRMPGIPSKAKNKEETVLRRQKSRAK